MDGSAFALARPLTESAYRAHWVYTCADAETVNHIFAGMKDFPGLSYLADELEQNAKNKGLFGGMKQHFKAMHDYTHSGFEQMSSRFDEQGNVRAFYDDATKIGILKLMSGMVSLAGPMWCRAIAADSLDGKQRAAAMMMFMNTVYDKWDNAK